MTSDPIELRLIDESKKRFRIYRTSNCTDLFGELCLQIEWGRIGRRLRVRLEPFTDAAALEQRKKELVEIRQRHGYTS